MAAPTAIKYESRQPAACSELEWLRYYRIYNYLEYKSLPQRPPSAVAFLRLSTR